MITAHDLKALADFLVDRHGEHAVWYADQAVRELETQGEEWRADAWRALRSVVVDLLAGRMSGPEAVTVH